MMAGEFLRPVGFFPHLAGSANAGQGFRLDELVWRHDRYGERELRARPGADQCNAAAIAVADQDRLFDTQRGNQGRQHFLALAVHVALGAGFRIRLGAAITGARPDDDPASGVRCELFREMPPHADAAQAFMQQHQGRPVCGGGGVVAVFESETLNGDVFHTLNKKSRTMAICSSDWNIGAWPTPGISASWACGPQAPICCQVSRVSRSDSAPRTTRVGQVMPA